MLVVGKWSAIPLSWRAHFTQRVAVPRRSIAMRRFDYIQLYNIWYKYNNMAAGHVDDWIFHYEGLAAFQIRQVD